MTTDLLIKPQTRPGRIIPSSEIQVDLAHSSRLDLCTKTIIELGLPATAVYIRPANVGIEDLLRQGNDRRDYLFRGISVPDL